MRGGLQRVLFELDAVERNARGTHPLHRIDPRAKILVTALYLAALLSVPPARLSEQLLYCAYPILLAPLGGLRYGTLLRRSLLVLPFAASIGVFNLFYDREAAFRIGSLVVTAGWAAFLSILLRGVLSAQALLLLISSTGGLRLCRSLQRLGLPALFTTQLLLVYRYLHVLVAEALAMQRARDARSFGRRSYPLKVWATLVGQLLLRTFGRAERIGRAMCARGFTGHIPADPFDRPNWHARDTLFLSLWSAALLLLRLYPPVEPLCTLLNDSI